MKSAEQFEHERALNDMRYPKPKCRIWGCGTECQPFNDRLCLMHTPHKTKEECCEKCKSPEPARSYGLLCIYKKCPCHLPQDTGEKEGECGCELPDILEDGICRKCHNLYTIGIEHEGKPNDIWTEEMKRASANLIREICKRWQIPIDRQHIVGHYQIFSQKPNCPSANKSIIDELITLASDQQGSSATIEDGVKKIEEGLAIINLINPNT